MPVGFGLVKCSGVCSVDIYGDFLSMPRASTGSERSWLSAPCGQPDSSSPGEAGPGDILGRAKSDFALAGA